MKDARLELLSDKVRMGEPINIIEALEVIEYQEALRKKRNSTFWRKLLHWVKG